jgi:probable phosphoglycerate mutase
MHKKIVYFVRHGQSEDNIAPVFQAPDSPLSSEGKEQARRIAERVSKIPFEVLIASPFQRAKETAEAIARATGKTPEFSDLFVERIKPKSVAGKFYNDPEADKIWRQWNQSLYSSGMRIEDGENFDDIIDRTDKALASLRAHQITHRSMS